MRPFVLLVSSVWIVAVGFCRRSSSVESPAPVLPVVQLYYDDGPAFRDSVRLVVRDQTRWAVVWRQATTTQSSPPPLPPVDFGREMVLVVGAGRLDAGHTIRVDSVAGRGNVLVAFVMVTVPCTPFPADAYPLQIVRVPRSNNEVAFAVRHQREITCP